MDCSHVPPPVVRSAGVCYRRGMARLESPRSKRTYERLSPLEQRALLGRIVDRCRTPSDVPAVVVFDLDGTLLDNRPRTLAILRDFVRATAGLAPDVHERVEAATVQDVPYLLTDTLHGLGVTDAATVAKAEAFWRMRFFADDYLRRDIPLPGAVHFVRACHQAGAVVVYLTGRDLPLMGVGTFRSLRDCGFPLGVAGIELVLKPDAAMPDEAFKRFAKPSLRRLGEVVAAFDNEPANCNLFLDGPESVLVDTQHMPGAPDPDPTVRVIADFSMDG